MFGVIIFNSKHPCIRAWNNCLRNNRNRNEDHSVRNIVFNQLKIGNQIITNPLDGRIFIGNYVNDVKFK